MKTKLIYLTQLCLVSMFLGCDDGSKPINSTQQGTQTTQGDDDSDDDNDNNGNDNGWAVSIVDIIDGGPGKDGIPALLNPEFVDVNKANYLSENDLVIGFKHGDVVKAYPHDILDWHEIVNDTLQSLKVSIIYCPLTGTGMAWNRNFLNNGTTFGVSGLLYNSNIIPYDRETNSNWSQMRLDCINGTYRGSKAILFPVIETKWKTFKEMYPNTKVLSTSTGYARNYGDYPYGNYKEPNSRLLFPVNHSDSRLPNKERVHGIINSEKVIVFRFDLFTGGTRLYEITHFGKQFVVVGNKEDNFIVSFLAKTESSGKLEFTPIYNSYPLIMKDNEGNIWDVFGEAQEGPRTGEKLITANSLIGYWFSFVAFYPYPEIFEP